MKKLRVDTGQAEQKIIHKNIPQFKFHYKNIAYLILFYAGYFKWR